CTTPVEEGMLVVGNTAKVIEARDDIIEFLLTSHPLDCPVCDKGGECPLQNLTIAHGPGVSRFVFDEKLRLAKRLPLGTPEDALIYLDRERCIQCARCTRFQDDVVDDHVIGFYERGRKLEIVTFSEPGFDSKFSGNTTDICPVGALTSADFRFEARPWEMNAVASICPHCPVGCNLTLNTRREPRAGGAITIQRVMPRQNEQVNEIWICDKGRFGHHFAKSPDRLTAPLIWRNGALQEVAWDEALTLVAAKFKAAGAGLAALLGDRLANEDLFNIRKLVTGLGGQVELNSQMGGGEQTQRVGVGAGTNLGAMGAGTAILIVASDLEEEAPIWWLRLKQAAERGATLIVANGRPTKTDRYANYQIRYEYGQEVATVLGMLVAGSSEAADAFARAENAVILFGREGLDFNGSSALAQACANLLIATHHYGRPNNGLVAVWPHNNTQGAWDMGVRARDLSQPMEGATTSWIVAADPVGDGLVSAEELRTTFVVVQELFLT
ncbi:MAG: molybdopterin-dependent oxidoreductase, partial [Anaerolineales bacterium]